MPAIPSSGAISLSDFATEFGGTVPHSLSEYYRDGGLVPSNNTNVPTSGVFAFSDMRGAVNAITQTLSNTTNVDLATLFGSDWASTVPKQLIIPSGVTVGGTGSSIALTASSGMGGTLEINNSGSILGFGGAINSGVGGDAVRISSAGVTINNSGLIAGGGGGGGLGGTGGQGRSLVFIGYQCGSTAGCDSATNAGTCGPVENPQVNYACYVYQYFAGGVGGSGGVGQGYNQSAATGLAGAAGGTNAGTGGTGGTGGSYGATGATGATGANGNYTNGLAGTAGGAGGRAVLIDVAYTMNNTGTIHGAYT